MGAVQRIRLYATGEDVTHGDVSGLLTELRAHLEDATVVDCGFKALSILVQERGYAQLVLDSGGAELVARALGIHGAESRLAMHALGVLGNMFAGLSGAALSGFGFLADTVVILIAAMHRYYYPIHRRCLDFFLSSCDVLDLLCSARAWTADLSSAVAEQAVEVLAHALSERHLNDLGSGNAYKPLRTLSVLTKSSTVAKCAAAAGCIELVIAILRNADYETDSLSHGYGCRALSKLCMASELRQLDACGFVDAALKSLRLFPDSNRVHVGGLEMLWLYQLGLKGAALDRDRLGPDAVQAALNTMRSSCPKINSRGMEGDFGASMVAALRAAMVLLVSLHDTRSSSWMLPLLEEPATAELLKCTQRWLDRSQQSAADFQSFVLRMTQGVCCGCDELQDEKMKRCSRCGRAAYCSPLCQRLHWPMHKRECKRQAAGADAGACDAE